MPKWYRCCAKCQVYTDEQSGSGPLSFILVSHAFASVAGRVKNSGIESDFLKNTLLFKLATDGPHQHYLRTC